MRSEKKLFSIQTKMFIFVLLTVLIVAMGTAFAAFLMSANRIDNYYKQCAADNARNFVSLVDADYLMELRKVAESEEFQAIRDEAEEKDDDSQIRVYLEEKGLWEKYAETQHAIDVYLENMTAVRYLYLSAVGDEDALYDMYVMDSSEEPLYQTGYYEEREAELIGLNLEELSVPTISNGDWGWLCSAFSPVYASDGQFVCVVGCDIGMDDVMQERSEFLITLLVASLAVTVIVLLIAVLFIHKTVVNPLNAMTTEMEKFKPAEHLSYEEAGVMDLPIRSHDEIEEIYQGIRSMETNIIDYLNDLSVLQEDKRKAKQQIDQLSEENNRDTLTGVGSKSAYAKKVDEINAKIASGEAEFAVVMVDMNNLKQVNDAYGHKAGDQYIMGCCHLICEAFKHSPVYRIGGDEFIVIAQGADYAARTEITEKLRQTFAASFAQEELELWQRYSAAVGMAENAHQDATVDLVFRRADKAMYEDKMRFKELHGSYR